jgi:predicted outer membrane repeat protein
MQRWERWVALAVLAALLLPLGRMAGAVIQGGPQTACTAAAIAAAIAGGGLVDVACASPTVITWANAVTITTETTIDGHGTLILDGQNAHPLLRSENNLQVTLRNLTIRNGRSTDQGAGIKVGFWNTFTATNVRFENNVSTKDTAQCDGGGAIFIGGGSTASIATSTFVNNQANNGGAINSLRTQLSVIDSTFDQNAALHTERMNDFGDCGGGGAIYIDGSRPPADGGPDILLLRGNTYTNNTSNNHGGAIFAGLYSNETLLVDHSSFEQNSVARSASASWSGTGGAIWYGFAAAGVTNEQLILSNTTLANNTAIGQGGGLWTDAPVAITNVTFTGNDATDPTSYPPSEEWRKGNGGALAVNNNAPVAITNVTFANNHAGFNGGAIAGIAITLRNTLFFNNTTDWSIKIMQHCTNALIDGGHNMQYPPKNPNPNYWNETNCTAGMATPVLTLEGLASNGGPTKTLALPSGSPAINAGNPATCAAVDQRGYTRAGVCDIGAYEANGVPFAPTSRVFVPLLRR